MSLTRGADRSLQLGYNLQADAGQLCLPAIVASPGRADALWRHTCFEVFVAGHRSATYREFNFSPSGEWAAYAFTAYRAGMRPLTLTSAPVSDWQRSPGQLALTVTLPADALIADDGALRIALSAVIEEQSGTITHWALCHPAGQPDFHHPDSFTLEP